MSREWFHMKTRFETEATENTEMAYSVRVYTVYSILLPSATRFKMLVDDTVYFRFRVFS